MAALVSLFRGINVGGNRRVGMGQLGALYQTLGLACVKTHLQSGNVVFRSDDDDAVRLSARLEDAVEAAFGFRPTILIRTARGIRETIARNPFPDWAASDPSHLLVMFLADAPGEAAAARLSEADVGPEQFRLSGRELYLYYPNGIGRSKLTNTLIEKRVGTVGTGRNWNTVVKLLEMAEAIAA
jgi:uncharacterized protein (DUF1697 family)